MPRPSLPHLHFTCATWPAADITYTTMAITRSRHSAASLSSTHAPKAMRISAPSAATKVSSPLKVTKKQHPKRLREHIERSFSHIAVPKDLALPQLFIDFHAPEFVKGVRHVIAVDPTLYPAIVWDNFAAFAEEKEPPLQGLQLILHYWISLVSSVISQQVSGAAAKAIKGRFMELFDNEPTPEKVLQVPSETLKGVGLLNMKVKYVMHISETFCSGDSNLSKPEFFGRCSSDELIEELVQLKGIGEWSAKMFSIFTLKQMDVFAHDDLGVARGVARYLQVRPQLLQEVKAGVEAMETLKAGLKKKAKFHSDKSKRDWVPVHDEYVKFLALRYQPYRLVFMMIMWRLSSTDIAALESE